MRDEYKFIPSLWTKTKGELVEDLKEENKPLFYSFDYAVPQPWLDQIRKFTKIDNLCFIWVYDETVEGFRHGFPFPVTHSSRIALETFYLEFGEFLFDIIQQEDGSHAWMQRNPILHKAEEALAFLLREDKINNGEFYLLLELFNSVEPNKIQCAKENLSHLQDFNHLFRSF